MFPPDISGIEVLAALRRETPVPVAILSAHGEEAGRVFSREELLNLIAERDFNKFDRSVDVHISSLRRKLADDSRCPAYLKTLSGIGYTFLKCSPCPLSATACTASSLSG